MKKLLIALAIIAFAFTAQAADLQVTWDHSGGADGFVLYFWQTSIPGNVYNKTVPGGTVRELLLPDQYFALGVEYSFEMVAYNSYGESDRSNRLAWTRPGTPYVVPGDVMPSTIYIKPTKPTVITIDVP